MGEIDLLALYWTVCGPAEVHVGREWSTFEWRDRCGEAARVGFKGIGLWHADIKHQLDTRTLKEMEQIFDDAGLTYLQVEFLADFFVEEGEPARKESDERRRMLFDTAAAFDAHHIKVGNIPGTPCEFGRLTEAFAELCQDAANNTAATVVYEFMPFDVNVNSLETALALVQDADQRNGAFLDTARGGRGPMLLECLTHRRRGHYEGDAQQYRDPKAEEEWLRCDPVARFQQRARAEKWLDEHAARAIAAEAKAMVEEAVEFARASPFPEPEIARELVYAP